MQPNSGKILGSEGGEGGRGGQRAENVVKIIPASDGQPMKLT